MLREHEKLAFVLAAALDGTVIESTPDKSVHTVIVRTPNDRVVSFDARWAGEGWPQDVRSVASDVSDPWPADVVVLARTLSPGSIDWLNARRANWADETGRARIFGPAGLVVVRESKRQPDARPVRRFRWSRSAITIAEAILAQEDQPLRVAELAGATGWSVAQTANVLASFDGLGWTTKQGTARGPGASRRLSGAGGMLASWSEAVSSERRDARLAHRATSEMMDVLSSDLAPALGGKIGWAVSGWAALNLAAPFATGVPSLHVYVVRTDFAGPLSAAIKRAGLHEVDEGGRVTFWTAGADLLSLARGVHGIPVVSAPRLYADLSGLGVRGQDAADHVRKLLIDPLHPGAQSRLDERHG